MAYDNIVEGIVELIRKAVIVLPDDVVKALKQACKIRGGYCKNSAGKYFEKC